MKRIAFFVILIALWLFVCIYIAVAEITEHAGAAEAEVLTWSHTDEEPPEVVWYYDGEPKEIEPVVNWVEAVERWPDAIGYITDNFGNTRPMWQPSPDKSVDVMITESNEPTDLTFDIVGGDLTLTAQEYFLEIHIEEEPNFAETDRIYLHKGKDFDIVIEKNEPNEPECTHENIKDSYTSCAVGHGDGSTCWVCPDCGEYVNSKESNENEWIRLPEPEPPMKYSLPIPTWPDFIELEKDLYIVRHDNDDVWQKYRKGTKIYFKDDEPKVEPCKHENGSDTICAVYHTDGSYCWVCSDCGKFINSKE